MWLDNTLTIMTPATHAPAPAPAPALAMALALVLALSFVAPSSALVMPSPPAILRASPSPHAPVSSRKVATPAALVGTWVGEFNTAFALADAANPSSWSCLVGGAVVSVPHSIGIGADGTVSDAPYSSVSVVDFPRGAALPGRNLTFPGTQAVAQYDILGANATILKLGVPMSSIAACHYAAVAAGSDGVPVLTLVSVGGALFSRDAPCSASTYTAANVTTTPFCTSSSPGGAALGTNVIGTYRLLLAPTPSSSSPSASASASASASVSASALSAAAPSSALGGPIDTSPLPSPPAASLVAAHSTSGASAAATAPLAATVLTLLAGVALGGFIERARA